MATRRLPSSALTAHRQADRIDTISILNQGPKRRINLWKEIKEDPNVDGKVTGYLFQQEGLLLIDLYAGGESE